MVLPWWAFAIGSAVFATIYAITRKEGLQIEHALEFASARTLSMAFLCLFLIPFVNFNVPKEAIAFVFFVSLIASFGILLMAKAYRHMELSHFYPLINLKSIFVVVLAYLFLSEKIGVNHLIGIGILLLGTYALEADHHFSDLVSPIKHLIISRNSLYLILALLAFSATALMDKYIVTNLLDPFTFMFFAWIFIAMILNVIHGYMYGFEEIKNVFKDTRGLPVLVGFFSLIANLLALKALTLAYVSLVTPVLMLSTLFVVLVGGRFFKEEDVLYRLAVSCVMLVGVYLIII